MASAGRSPILDVGDISVREYDLAGIFDVGTLTAAQFSTVVSDSETGVEVVREGAVSVDQLRELLPDIIVPGSTNSKPRE